MVSFFRTALAVAAASTATSQLASAVLLDDANNTASIRDAASTLAFEMQSYYSNNQSSTPAIEIGMLPLEPWYWWLAGAMWGGMVDYWAYTGDESYNANIQQALIAQTGPDSNYMPPERYGELGNDDQAFWALSALSAHEYNFPPPTGQGEDIWLDLAVNVFDTQAPRWNTDECAGGLKWQVFSTRDGWNYKNSVSNGAFLQIAARLARITGNQTYVDWAERTWDWMNQTGLIGDGYQVFAGSDDLLNCTEINHDQWSYNPAILLYGSATMANLTNDALWQQRTDGLLTSILNTFFSPYENSTAIMYEPHCEPDDDCNTDQSAFKGFLSRWMAKSAVLQPSINAAVSRYLRTSAEALNDSCTGGTNGRACGQKWYTGNNDGDYGVGQQLSAMETVQALLLLNGNATRTVPRTQANVEIEVVPNRSEFPLTPPQGTSASSPGGSDPDESSAAGANLLNSGLLSLSFAVLLVLLAVAFGNGFR